MIICGNHKWLIAHQIKLGEEAYESFFMCLLKIQLWGVFYFGDSWVSLSSEWREYEHGESDSKTVLGY